MKQKLACRSFEKVLRAWFVAYVPKEQGFAVNKIISSNNLSIIHEDESIVVIRFRDPHGIDFPYLVSMIHDSWMSRANSIVIPGGKLDLAMQLILTPLIKRLKDRSKKSG